MSEHVLKWAHGEAVVLSTAAVLADCRFDLGGKAFRPFARAPWMGTVTDMSIIGHLRELGGDFVCVPMGSGGPAPQAPPEWAALMDRPRDWPIHGPAADEEWTITAADASSVTLSLDYPETSPVLRLERRVAVRPDAPALDSTLTIFARRAAPISVGLHPIFRLPEQPGRLRLEAEFAFGLVHPRQVAGEQEFSSLAAVPQANGPVDVSHPPLGSQKNLNVQLCGMRSPMKATWLDEGAGMVLDWDRTQLPSLQIWHTNRGVEAPPWNGQYRGLGLEPIAAAFDLNDAISTGPNPINRRGVATAIDIRPETPTIIRHSVVAFSS